MFSEFFAKAQVGGFTVRWKWQFENGGELPNANIFYCRISEEEVIANSLFEENEILLYIVNNLIHADFLHPRDGIRRYISMNRSNEDIGIKNEKLLRGGAVTCERIIEYNGKPTGLYVVCLYTDEKAEWKLIVPIELTQESVDFKVKNRMFAKYSELEVTGDSYRNIILQSEYAGKKIYSLLPRGFNRLFIEKQNTKDIKPVYLTSMIK